MVGLRGSAGSLDLLLSRSRTVGYLFPVSGFVFTFGYRLVFISGGLSFMGTYSGVT